MAARFLPHKAVWLHMFLSVKNKETEWIFLRIYTYIYIYIITVLNVHFMKDIDGVMVVLVFECIKVVLNSRHWGFEYRRPSALNIGVLYWEPEELFCLELMSP